MKPGNRQFIEMVPIHTKHLHWEVGDFFRKSVNPIKDSIAIEDKNSPYVNIITVRKGDENKKKLKRL